MAVNIGMSVPGASDIMGAQNVSSQVAAESEEERRKKLALMRQAQQLPVGATSLGGGYGAALSGY
jgi:hypothetical protein